MLSRMARSGVVRSQFNQVRAFAASPFPSLTISSQQVAAQGSFAEQQHAYLTPDPSTVTKLSDDLKGKNMGVVAHFYMDAELQGTLAACNYEHIFCSDSLAMGDAAVKMARGGANSIACLGVDFMSESVRATLDAHGFPNVPVFRLAEAEIGCSLAASAERLAYDAYLDQASKAKNPLHVIYINTSMTTKAKSQKTVPTITCTSSNVVRTILQAAAQVPDVTIWYGPDTYMGQNLHTLFTRLTTMTDADVQSLHPDHTVATVKSLLERFHYFQQGICVVHHMFGQNVTDRVAKEYPCEGDVYYTAHFEVPGEMFDLAMKAQQVGRGVVGSTSNILNFIVDKAKETSAAGGGKAKFVLGTESGMVTSIVRGVQEALKADGGKTQVEIIFPVAAEAVTATGVDGLELVPGVQGGEGCSTAGGCATCPYMKMNDLDGLVDLVAKVEASGSVAGLEKQLASIDGDVAFLDHGRIPIADMRHLMKAGELSPELVAHITTGTRP